MEPMKNYRAFRTLCLFALCFAVAGITAATPQNLGIEVTPAKFELAIPPGTPPYNIPITIRNSSGGTVHIVSTMTDFGLTKGGEYAFGKPGTRPYSLLRWATINPREFDLPADSTQQVRMTLTVPKSMSLSGEYAGIVFFQTRPVRHAQAVSVSVRIATKIYATIPGTVKLAGAITKMNASNAPGGESYHVLFKNTGNAHVYVNGNLEVRKGGALVDRIPLPSSELVERGGERLLEVSGKALTPGKYQIIALVDYGGSTMTGGEIEFEKK
jgi:hypothetical protein